MNWTELSFIPDTLNNYFFGSSLALSIAVIVLFVIVIMSVGFPFTYTILLTIPLIAGLVVGGMVGVNAWILNLSLIVAGIIYGGVLIKLLT